MSEMVRTFKSKDKIAVIKNILFYLLLVCFCGAVGYLSLGKNFDFNIYWSLSSGGDGLSISMIIKSIQENGIRGAYFNHRIGAPEISTILDFPAVGNSMLIVIYILSKLIKSTSSILYIYLIWSFIIDGISMAVLLQKLKVSKWYSFVFSTLFSFAPYHFYRYLGHSTLIDYSTFPIVVYLGLVIIGYFKDEKKWKIVLCCVLLGLGYGYYYAFGLIVLAVAIIIRFIKEEKKINAFKQLWIIGIVLISIAIFLMPNIIYSYVNGKNTESGSRVFYEQEIYGLKIVQLLLPVSYSRLDFLSQLTNSYNNSGAPLINENYTSSLGIIGDIGFVYLCASLIYSLINKEKETSILLDFLSLSTLVLILTGSIGGFGEIFNYLVTGQIRCYNRSSIFILGFSLIGMAIFINKLSIKKTIGNFPKICLSLVILLVGCYDQVRILNDNYQVSDREKQTIYEEFFKEVENLLPESSMVYQLPYFDYPEAGGVNNISDYKPFIGYIFTDNLRWSYGGVRGRNTKAKELYVGEGMTHEFIIGIKEAGFAAVYIDIDGYTDNGEAIFQFYNSLGVKQIVSQDKKLYVYDISNLDIPLSWRATGVSFIKRYGEYCGISYTESEILEISQAIENKEIEVYTKLYESADFDKLDDSEYIDVLYQQVLNRNETSDEREGWISQLKLGVTRQQAFNMFLESREFRINNKFDN